MRRRSRQLPTVILSVVLLGIAFWGYRIYSFFSSHVYEPGAASTRAADVTELTSVPPPAEARDFRVASFDYLQARLVFVRFSAPVARFAGDMRRR